MICLLQEESDGVEELLTDTEEEVKTVDVNSKTLKYQFQTAQNELKRQIENLEQLLNANKLKISDLEDSLSNERHINTLKSNEIKDLKEELVVLTQRWKESCNEAQQLRDKVTTLKGDLETAQEELSKPKMATEEEVDSKQFIINNDDMVQSDCNRDAVANISTRSISDDHFQALEEELVILKERFAQVNDEKLMLSKSLSTLNDQYNCLRNRSHNTMFFYIAPVVLTVLYLLISSMFS